MDSLPLDDPFAHAFEFDEPTQLHQLREALLVAQRRDHPCEIADRGDGGPDTAPEWLTRRGAAQIVVSARAQGLRNDLQLPMLRRQLKHGLGCNRALVECRRASVRLCRIEIAQRAIE